MLIAEPDDEASTSLPIAPICTPATDPLIDRIERLLNERHANLVDATTAVVAGLHEDLVSLNERLDHLADALAAPTAAIAELRRDLTALELRVAALEARS